MKCDRYVGTGISKSSNRNELMPVSSISGRPTVLDANTFPNTTANTIDISVAEGTMDNNIKCNTSPKKVCPLDLDLLIVIRIHPENHTYREHKSIEGGNRISIRENKVCI